MEALLQVAPGNMSATPKPGTTASHDGLVWNTSVPREAMLGIASDSVQPLEAGAHLRRVTYQFQQLIEIIHVCHFWSDQR
ncbi:hypothetical protein [Bradyrhizobium uaiense]|uniref:Uncharacterized protein n=1 Tax=Bradyrhizobium uaiense TaxID=2594946 RepID=A0A6P1BJ65_9BRAD|nr:hypothetical protein [Bradyrhizobium uaiense]NEU98204.1 hypothetical protein [Bradyrhizobium uaiense]